MGKKDQKQQQPQDQEQQQQQQQQQQPEQTSLNALWRVWEDHEAIKLPDTQYTLRGWSIAALRTNFYISELAIMLDAGLSGNLSPEHIFISHSHADHIANLPFHLYSAHGKVIQIYVPSEAVAPISKMLDSMVNINAGFADVVVEGSDVTESVYRVVGVDPDTMLPLTLRKKQFNVRIIKCDHGVPCVGYGFNELRNKLKEQYSSLSGREIGELKRQGVEVTMEVAVPVMCFIGDTSKEVLKNEQLWAYRTVMIECTFIHEDDLEQADKTKHIHWRSLEPHVRKHTENTFILYHFSQRYKKAEVEKFFSDLALPNVIAWAS